MSHPSWVRGLKPETCASKHIDQQVAPLVGAWIETRLLRQQVVPVIVAPLVGAWIETKSLQILRRYGLSHPSWVRGLKRNRLCKKKPVYRSHPSWVRGLKLWCFQHRLCIAQSHPSWVRGLKPNVSTYTYLDISVAPLVGAWIETVCVQPLNHSQRSHPSWVRGLKRERFRLDKVSDSRTPRGCVD